MRRPGFTLIELMIVVAIIGILAAIAIPKFAELLRKADEGQTKGNLGAVRSSLSIYYGDMEGLYPAQLVALTANGKFLQALPYSKVRPYHEPRNVQTNAQNQPNVEYGNWWYVNVPGDANFGTLRVNCTHTDTKGSVWTSY